MINIAQSKGVYDVIKKADLMKALPFDNKSFDLLVTAAVTTYLGRSLKNILYFNWQRISELLSCQLLPINFYLCSFRAICIRQLDNTSEERRRFVHCP